MVEATVRFDRGAETVTIHLPVELPTGGVPLSGDVSGTFGDCFVAGDLNLTGNLFIEGLMTGLDTFHIQGNGFTVFFQNGGQVDLHGKFKAAWGPWGTDTTGWVVGDRLAVAATKVGIYVPSELVWSSWSMARPANSPDVTLVDGSVRKPEVVNLNQSIVLENLGRGFHFHDSAGVQSLSDVKFLNCGTPGITGNYPCHFHLLGDNSRGSLLERVVVEGGKNHAYVQHGSHGTTLKGCVAYNTVAHPYWWDFPLSSSHTANNSNDTTWERCLAMYVTPAVGDPGYKLGGFVLGTGHGNKCIDSVATCVQGSKGAAGYVWPESANQNAGGTVWIFERDVAHNCKSDGINVWQNDSPVHFVDDFVAFHNRESQIDHGAYINGYQYRRMVLKGGIEGAFKLHALSVGGGPITIEDTVADQPLIIFKHTLNSTEWIYIRRSTFSSVQYRENTDGGAKPSKVRFEDCAFTPAKFDFTGPQINAASIIEIYEAGVLKHRWAGGWS